MRRRREEPRGRKDGGSRSTGAQEQRSRGAQKHRSTPRDGVFAEAGVQRQLAERADAAAQLRVRTLASDLPRDEQRAAEKAKATRCPASRDHTTCLPAGHANRGPLVAYYV